MRLNILLILILFSCSLAAQSGDDSHAIPEERFAQVRMLADSGDLFAARELAKEILIVDPGYNDVSIYLARLYGRDTMYDSAMSIIDTVLNGNPNNADAHLARCDLLYWSNDWNALEGAASEGLEVIPDHPDLLYKRALALYHLGDPRASFEMVEKVLHNDSAHAAAKRLERLLYTERDHPELFVRYMFDYFNDPYLRRWRMISLGGSLPLAKGTVSPSLLAGHLDNDSVSFRASSAIQLNTDAYFDIGEMNYMLIGYGLGTGTYLPRHKALVQFWQTLPAGWSVNAGVRYFYFDQHYVFYAAGIDKYVGNFWIDLKSYIFYKGYGLSFSPYLTARWYLENKYNYYGATIGYGTSPDEPVTSEIDLLRLNALSARLSVMRQITGGLRFSGDMGYQFEEYREQLFRNRFSFQAGLIIQLD